MAAGEAAIRPREDVPLAPLTTIGIGGSARWYLRARTVDEVRSGHAWARDRGVPLFVLGGGSNIVVSDAGFPGLVLHVGVRGVVWQRSGDDAVVDAGAGESWDDLVSEAVEGGYAGIECLSGIPGLVGGTPIQNVGAYGQEVADAIQSIVALDAVTNEMVSIPAAECGFSYRNSRFKRGDAGRFTVCRVRFRLRRGRPRVAYPDVIAWVERSRLREPDVRDIRRGVLEIRRGKGMVLDPADPDTRSVGSFFVNPVVSAALPLESGAPLYPMADGRVKIAAAWLIQRAGFPRGFEAGPVGLSSRHPLAIVNRGGARAEDVLDLACRIKRAVLDRFGIALLPEPVFVGLAGDARVRFLQRAD